MHRATLLSCSIAAACLFTLGACGEEGGGRGDAKFGAATATQRERAASAGIGGDALIGYLAGAEISSLPSTSLCPTVVQTGTTFAATYDCTDGDGQRIDGRVTTTNVAFGGGEVDPTQDGTIAFEDYHRHATATDDELFFDGTIRLAVDQSLVVSLDATFLGVAVRTDAIYRRDGDRTAATDGDTVDVEGVGVAFIGGAWSTSQATRGGVLELEGAELLRVDFDAWVDGCAPMTVGDSAAGQLCGF